MAFLVGDGRMDRLAFVVVCFLAGPVRESVAQPGDRGIIEAVLPELVCREAVEFPGGV